MKHVTREDIDRARAELAEAKRSLEAAKAAKDEKRRVMDGSGLAGTSRLNRVKKGAEDWLAAAKVVDDRHNDVERAARLIKALCYQRRTYLARCAAEKVLSECASLGGKPCRYKRTKKAVENACASIDGAVCYLGSDGCIYVRDAEESIYSDCKRVYVAKYDGKTGDYLFDASIIERYLADSDGIPGMLAHVLDGQEVRRLVGDLDKKVSDACEKLREAHKAARELESAYGVVGLRDYVEAETKRAVY